MTWSRSGVPTSEPLPAAAASISGQVGGGAAIGHHEGPRVVAGEGDGALDHGQIGARFTGQNESRHDARLGHRFGEHAVVRRQRIDAFAQGFDLGKRRPEWQDALGRRAVVLGEDDVERDHRGACTA